MQVRNLALRLKAERGLDLIVADSDLVAGTAAGMTPSVLGR
jgi:hypothetical protein